MIVVPYQPWRTAFNWVVIILIVVSSSAGFYFYGYGAGIQVSGDAREERDTLLIQMDDMNSQMSFLQQELINAEQASAVDRQALEEVQDTILNFRETIAQLEEDVLYYKKIMSPENNDTGLMIGQLDLVNMNDAGRVRYRLELRQVGNNDNIISGYANVNILGSQDRQEISMPLRSVAVDENQLDIRLQFRYFQNIQGELLLPERFEPVGVQIIAVDEGNDETVQKSFAWVVE
jgi:hypothetical protein